ncbi:ANXA4 protein, partial [Polypterus senegalus]
METKGASVKPFAQFDAKQDAEALYAAIKGLGTDEDTILQLLTARNNTQRQQIAATYKNLYGKDQVDNLKSELGGKSETIIVGLMTPLVLNDVNELRAAINGAGTDEHVLIEILASRTAKQIKEMLQPTKKNMVVFLKMTLRETHLVTSRDS